MKAGKAKARYMSLLLSDEVYKKLQEVKAASISKTNMTQIIIDAFVEKYKVKRTA